ncbi:MAG TPA: 16S rRNA (cytosine(1402)-N(4))-methyltransferase RsmH [Patescibacteria group bacterium]|jgi:16S rRNA (cytosine1402-N4)-methyltransferase|nr:16S rRNA (cytosine(1402)-N(4))-methyltransferase RsmH [Patescibacteria group bacterium]
MSIKEHPPHHVPVLLDACLDVLQPKVGENYLDLTAGYGGHAAAFLSRTQNYADSCLVDRDDAAIAQLQSLSAKGTRLLHDDFVTASRTLIEEGKTFDMVLADLGVSSPQLDKFERGFSFTNSGPLDMRMDRRQEQDAACYLNSVRETDLTTIIHAYGEEPISVAKRYAHAIVTNRPIESTGQLKDIIENAHVGRWQKVHPATRTFQAIRIEVNQELTLITQLLPLVPKLLKPGGRVGIISFHSLEDRLVKRYFNEQARSGYEAELDILTKQPRYGTEDVHNPRARSAKLRAAVKK